VNANDPRLVAATSPFQKRPVDTPTIMRHVIYALIPVMLAAVYYFGLSALLLLAVCTVVCVLTEWLLSGRGRWHASTISDGSAIVTGILLALTLPPSLPLWMASVGAAIAVLFGKLLFGGLGQNVFNPSLTGRAFLQAAFPVAMTTWSEHSGADRFLSVQGDALAPPFLRPHFDVLSGATPLARMKFEFEPTEVTDLLMGSTSGSLGETAAVLILLGGVYLAWRRFLNWRLPVGIFASVYLFASALHFIDPSRFPDGVHHLFAGGLVLGAMFMATDPVTSPVTPRGCWIFAVGVGLLVIVIRQFGGLPEGVMYAILLMNAATPLIDRFTQPVLYGSREQLQDDEYARR
jgi:electron transport complex protein RnfD